MTCPYHGDRKEKSLSGQLSSKKQGWLSKTDCFWANYLYSRDNSGGILRILEISRHMT
ncbi:MAG: sarcosine oxidase subunit delta [Rhizobiaceae bacterium]|nr:sarcosine oxidase subunit delta [Rhizobiaceae bacterium]